MITKFAAIVLLTVMIAAAEAGNLELRMAVRGPGWECLSPGDCLRLLRGAAQGAAERTDIDLGGFTAP